MHLKSFGWMVENLQAEGRLERRSSIERKLVKSPSNRRLLWRDEDHALFYENDTLTFDCKNSLVEQHHIPNILHFEMKTDKSIVYRSSDDLKDYEYDITLRKTRVHQKKLPRLLCCYQFYEDFIVSYRESDQHRANGFIGRVGRDLETLKWSYPRLRTMFDRVLYRGVVYQIGSHPFTLMALNADQGEVAYLRDQFEDTFGVEAQRIEINDGIRVHGDTIVACLTQKNTLLGIDRHTGEVSWKAEGISGRKYLATEEGLLYTICKGYLNAIRMSDGKLLSSIKLEGDRFLPGADPRSRLLGRFALITDTHIFVRWSMGAELEAYDLQTGKIGFSERLPGSLTKADVYDGKLYLSTSKVDIENPEKGYLVYGPV